MTTTTLPAHVTTTTAIDVFYRDATTGARFPRRRRPRIFVTLPESLRPATPAWLDHTMATSDEIAANDREWATYLDVVNTIKREFVMRALEENPSHYDDMIVSPKDLKYCARVACRCGCSPCFMFKNPMHDALLNGSDWYVTATVVTDPVVDTSYVDFAEGRFANA